MKIIHFITGIGKASGASTFCGGLCNELAVRGHEVVVAVCTSQLNEECYELDARIRVVSIESVLASNEVFDCAQVHGIWEMPIHQACVWLRARGIPYVISPHGSLAPWAMRHHAWKKWIAWHLWFRRDMQRAAAIHVTAESEREWLAKFGLGRGRSIVLAPLGTSLPQSNNRTIKQSNNSTRTLLYVGRIYPVKALDNLIRAVALMKQPITLRLVGPDQANHMAELMSLCYSLHLPCTKPGEENSALQLQLSTTTKQVQFVGPKYDAELSAEYDACDALALVSHTENFGATVVEALAHGKPVITSTKTPWREVVDGHCGWWVDNDPKALSKAIGEFVSLTDAQRRDMGASGRALVVRKYTWEAIAAEMAEAYGRVMRW